MTRLQSYLLVALVTLTALVFGRVAWDFLVYQAAPAAGSALAAVPALFAAVPAWIWWTAFGIAMSVICPMKAALRGQPCRRSHRAHHRACRRPAPSVV